MNENIRCHYCVYGAAPGLLLECSYPYLRLGGKLIPRTLRNTLLMTEGNAVAKAKGLTDFNPLRAMAIAAEMEKGNCTHYKHKEWNAPK